MISSLVAANSSQPSWTMKFQGQEGIEKVANVIQAWLGAATMLANLFIIVVFLKDRYLRDRHLFILLAVGDFLDGVYFAYGGFRRSKEMAGEYYYAMMSPWDCAMKFYATFQILGLQLPDFATLMISIERILAVSLPFWYHAKFTTRHRFGLLLTAALICIISLIIYFLTVWPLQQKTTPWANCAMTYSSNSTYSMVHQISTLVIQIAAFSLSTFAFIQAQRKSRAVAAMRKEAQSIKPILAVSLFSVILISVPQIYLLSLRAFGSNVNTYVLYTVISLPCINSLLNFFVYLWLTKDFRLQFIGLILCRKVIHSSNAVTSNGFKNPKNRIAFQDNFM